VSFFCEAPCYQIRHLSLFQRSCVSSRLRSLTRPRYSETFNRRLAVPRRLSNNSLHSVDRPVHHHTLHTNHDVHNHPSLDRDCARPSQHDTPSSPWRRPFTSRGGPALAQCFGLHWVSLSARPDPHNPRRALLQPLPTANIFIPARRCPNRRAHRRSRLPFQKASRRRPPTHWPSASSKHSDKHRLTAPAAISGPSSRLPGTGPV
jgi:hypothetical protein